MILISSLHFRTYSSLIASTFWWNGKSLPKFSKKFGKHLFLKQNFYESHEAPGLDGLSKTRLLTGSVTEFDFKVWLKLFSEPLGNLVAIYSRFEFQLWALEKLLIVLPDASTVCPKEFAKFVFNSILKRTISRWWSIKRRRQNQCTVWFSHCLSKTPAITEIFHAGTLLLSVS